LQCNGRYQIAPLISRRSLIVLLIESFLFMIKARERLGLLLGFLGMCLFAGALPATRLAVANFDRLFPTV
jgi:hypothetical protein